MFKSIISIAITSVLCGCASTLPSHDGSLHTVYGIKNAVPAKAVPLDQAEAAPQATAVETYQPTVQTISSTGVIAASPISAIEVEPQTPEQAEPALTEARSEIKEKTTVIPTTDYEHTLGAGETLFSVAGDLTGSSSNWKAIADYNDISDPEAITVGQSIVIPGKLLVTAQEEELSGAADIIETIRNEQKQAPDEEDLQTNITVSANGTQEVAITSMKTVEKAPSTVPLMPVKTATGTTPYNNAYNTNGVSSVEPKGSLTKSFANFASIITTSFTVPAAASSAAIPTPVTSPVNMAVLADEPTSPGNTTNDASMTVKTTMLAKEPLPDQITSPQTVPEAQVDATNEQPSDELNQPAAADLIQASTAQWIQVGGDFTPKAIYKGAGYTSGLLMRVSPGTKFKMTNKTDDWYEIETNQGAGYIFHRDALLSE